jgi:CheY-like chemotaxis protein
MNATLSDPTNPSTVLENPAEPRPRVLFVDDEPLLARLGKELLRRMGYDPVTVTCPVEALELFRAQPFDAIITDLTMPRMSGIEFARAVQATHPNVPIVLTTAFHQKLEGQTAAGLGFSALLPKPYSAKTLGEAIQRALITPPKATPMN